MLCVQSQACSLPPVHFNPLYRCFLRQKNKERRHRADILSLLFLIYSQIQRPVALVQLLPSSRKLFQLCTTHSITWRHMDLFFFSDVPLYTLVKIAWLFWHARCGGDLTCAVTPAAPYVLQLGKLHSARLSSRGAIDPSAPTTQWIRWPRGDATNVLFKEAEPPLLPV